MLQHQLQQFFSVRQNPCANTNQQEMRELILEQKIVTCPFGHFINERNNVINGEYNESSNSQSQDRDFVEKMNIGDIIVIPFAGIKECILARIVSDPIYAFETNLFTNMRDGEIHLDREGDVRFRPVARRIHIIRDDVVFNDKRVLPMKSLSRINPNIITNNT